MLAVSPLWGEAANISLVKHLSSGMAPDRYRSYEMAEEEQKLPLSASDILTSHERNRSAMANFATENEPEKSQ
jgi:hypothetical protein